MCSILITFLGLVGIQACSSPGCGMIKKEQTQTNWHISNLGCIPSANVPLAKIDPVIKSKDQGKIQSAHYEDKSRL